MIKFFFKYCYVFYLFNSVLLSIEKTFEFGFNLYVLLMAIFSFCLLINPRYFKLIIFHKAFKFFFLINILNFIYWLFVHEFSNIEALKYLLARTMQFTTICFAVFFNYNYFKSDFFKHFLSFILIIIFIGIFANSSIFSGRYSGLLWNPNMLASLCSIAFAAVVIVVNKSSNFYLPMLVLFLLVSLSTGSRMVVLSIPLAFLFRYKLSFKFVFYFVLCSVIYFLIINTQLETSINRFASQSLFNDRLLQYKYAYETFLQKPYFGHGLEKYAYINTDLIPSFLSSYIISAHNGYLAIFVQYGIFFGSLILFSIFYQSVYYFRFLNKDESSEVFYFYIILYAILASFFETLMTGINELHTILFWFSFAFLSFSIYKRKYEN